MLRHRAHLRVEPPDHERAVVVHHGELLLGDIREGRPEPARVLEAHGGEHLGSSPTSMRSRNEPRCGEV
jgi:hypothetical protein